MPLTKESAVANAYPYPTTCPSATAISSQQPSPFCHPELSEGSAVLLPPNESPLTHTHLLAFPCEANF